MLIEQLLKLTQNASSQQRVSVLTSDECPIGETVCCCRLVMHKCLQVSCVILCVSDDWQHGGSENLSSVDPACVESTELGTQ